MQHQIKPVAAALAAAVLLAGCGGAFDGGAAPDDTPSVTRVELLASSARAMDSVVFRDGHAYVALGNTAGEGTAVQRAPLPLSAASAWTPVALGACALPRVDGEFVPPRSPRLKLLGDTIWLFHPWVGDNEHSACAMPARATAFAPRDGALRACDGSYCETLSMSDLKVSGTRLYTNAGAGINLFASGDGGASWRVLRGGFAGYSCTHTKFEVVGERVLVGGECPLDDAFLEAYQLSADGMALASSEKLPLSVPELENRNVQFIEAVPGTQRVFVGVEGGLLRSDDGGKRFEFVIHNPLEGAKAYPYMQAFLPLRGRPGTIVVGGFDKENFRPYLAFTQDGGKSWTDISSLLPGYTRPAGGDTRVAVVTSLAQDPQGRILVTMNEREDQHGRLLLLTLGRP